jgi:hypothetical protein
MPTHFSWLSFFLYVECHGCYLGVTCYDIRPVVPGGAGGAMAPPDFGRSVNPISINGDRLWPPNNTGTPGFSDLPTALDMTYGPWCIFKNFDIKSIFPQITFTALFSCFSSLILKEFMFNFCFKWHTYLLIVHDSFWKKKFQKPILIYGLCQSFPLSRWRWYDAKQGWWWMQKANSKRDLHSQITFQKCISNTCRIIKKSVLDAAAMHWATCI